MNLLDFIRSETTKTKITNELLISGVVHDLETEITGGGGEVRSCILSLSRHSVENNEVHLHGIIHDITELKKIEKATVQAEKLAATWRLARTLAHEVRNPLSTIQMSVEQLEDLSNDDEHGLFLDIIKRNADRINRLITQLLESSGQLEIQVELVDLQKLIEETVQLAKDRINLKNIQVNVESLLPPFLISAHPEKLKIALLNILVNAIDAVEPAEGVIMIRLLKDENACKIILEDNGCGIPRENLGNLFEPYFTSKKNGMGLGLAMTLNIVKAHLGEIEVISEVDKGTNFIITLPLIKDTLKHEREKQINL
jgi:signal transduction histidine kinase